MTTQLSVAPSVVDTEIDLDSSFFAPDSVTWRLMLGPYAVPALISTLSMFEAYPPCSIMGSQSVAYEDLTGRSTRTLEYIYVLTFGKQRDALPLIAHVNAMHDTVKCDWQGREYCASEPRNLLWLFVPFFDQLIKAHDAYARKPLTLQERDQIWREAKVIGLANRIPEEMVPTSQAEADEYLADMRPRLAVTAEARAVQRLIFAKPWATDAIVPMPLVPLVRLVLESGVALAPDYVLSLYGSSRPSLVRKATIAAYRPLFRALEVTPVVRDAFPMVLGKQYRAMVREARAARKAALSGEGARG